MNTDGITVSQSRNTQVNIVWITHLSTVLADYKNHQSINSPKPFKEKINSITPRFTLGGKQWYLELRKEKTGNSVSTYLVCCEGKRNDLDALINCKIILLEKGQNHFTKEIEMLISAGQSICVFQNIHYYHFFDEQLTLHVELTLMSSMENMFYESNICSDLENLLETGELSDVHIVMNGEIIKAHKIILLSRCPGFIANFQQQFIDKSVISIIIDDIEVNVMKELLRYIYCGKVNNIEDVDFKLYIIAEKFNMLNLKKICIISLGTRITVDNVVDMLLFSDQYNIHNLREWAVSFITSNAKKIVKAQNWQEMFLAKPKLALELYSDLAINK